MYLKLRLWDDFDVDNRDSETTWMINEEHSIIIEVTRNDMVAILQNMYDNSPEAVYIEAEFK